MKLFTPGLVGSGAGGGGSCGGGMSGSSGDADADLDTESLPTFTSVDSSAMLASRSAKQHRMTSGFQNYRVLASISHLRLMKTPFFMKHSNFTSRAMLSAISLEIFNFMPFQLDSILLRNVCSCFITSS